MGFRRLGCKCSKWTDKKKIKCFQINEAGRLNTVISESNYSFNGMCNVSLFLKVFFFFQSIFSVATDQRMITLVRLLWGIYVITLGHILV